MGMWLPLMHMMYNILSIYLFIHFSLVSCGGWFLSLRSHVHGQVSSVMHRKVYLCSLLVFYACRVTNATLWRQMHRTEEISSLVSYEFICTQVQGVEVTLVRSPSSYLPLSLIVYVRATASYTHSLSRVTTVTCATGTVRVTSSPPWDEWNYIAFAYSRGK